MLFWTIIGLIVASAVYFVSRSMRDSYNTLGDHVIIAVMNVFFGGILGAIAFFAVALATNAPLEEKVVGESTRQLKALGNNSAIEGRSYFLGGGYVNDKRVLNFITSDGGAIKVQQADADKSTIYEDATSATVKVTHVDYVNGWLTTWPLGDKHEYEFHIPADSVVESYALDNK